jgi:hypothetical protein
MKKPSVAIVAPVHIQPSARWVDALLKYRGDARVIIVDDSNGAVQLPEMWDLYPYDRQKDALGEKLFAQFQQFHRSPSCKNFGVWKAWCDGADIIVVIDSDCIIPENFLADHVRALEGVGDGWENPLAGIGWYSRGFPYHKRAIPVDLHMGLWTNELDLYGRDRVEKGEPPKEPGMVGVKNAHGIVPLSGMNLAVRRELAPAMLFLPNYKRGEVRFDRHDDIWGGYILQKIMEKMHRKLSYGEPFVFHETIVDPVHDAALEEGMIACEKNFYDLVDRIFGRVTGKNYQELFTSFAQEAEKDFSHEYEIFSPLLSAFRFWALLFQSS